MSKALGGMNAHYLCDSNEFQRLDRDQIAGSDEAILPRFPEDIIYVAVDRHGKVIAFGYPRAVQAMFGDEDEQEIANLLGRYAKIEPPHGCDATRTSTQELFWLKNNERFRKTKPGKSSGKDKTFQIQVEERDEEEEPEKFAGLYHWGAWHERGIVGIADPVFKTADTVASGSHVTRIRDELMHGAMGVLTKVASFFLGSIDPELLAVLANSIEIVKYTPAATYTVQEEPFTLRLGVMNMLTESHIDRNDVIGGLATLVTVGNYEGGDICVPALGLRFPFPPGSVFALRGRELRHFIVPYTGRRRYSMVHTNHHSVQQVAANRKSLSNSGDSASRKRAYSKLT